MAAFWKFVTEEWYFAGPMLVLSFVAFTLVFWRLLLNLDARTNLHKLLPPLEQMLRTQGIAAALRYCQAQPNIIPQQLYVAGLTAAPLGAAAMRRAMTDVIVRDVLPDLTFLLPPILAIAKIATMVGLLGTVVSMIQTFQRVSEAQASAAYQGGAIGLALFATAFGLLIAIPLVFVHVLLKDGVHRFEKKMRYAAEKLVEMVERQR
jgi:biopolymer transport protein ExbB